jgi:hypothetical protein
MRRFCLLLAGAALACVPAVVGLMGNQSFSEEVAVRVPPQVAADVASGARAERPTPAVSPSTTAFPPATASPGTEAAERRVPAPAASGDRTTSRRSSDTRQHASAPSSGKGPSVGGTGRRELEPGDDSGAARKPGDDATRSRRGSGTASPTSPKSGSGSSGSGSSGSGSSGSGSSGSGRHSSGSDHSPVDR